MRNEIDGPVSWLFGGTVTGKRSLMELASPITHVSQAAPPFLIAHGTPDETVPFDQGRRLYEALLDVGATAEFCPMERLYHNWMAQVASEIPGREDTRMRRSWGRWPCRSCADTSIHDPSVDRNGMTPGLMKLVPAGRFAITATGVDWSVITPA